MNVFKCEMAQMVHKIGLVKPLVASFGESQHALFKNNKRRGHKTREIENGELKELRNILTVFDALPFDAVSQQNKSEAVPN
jgi:hypothetical protein